MWGLEMNLDSSLVHGTSGCSHLTHRAGREPQPLGSTRVLAVHGGHKEGAKDPPGHWALFQALEVAPRSSSRVTILNTKTGHQDEPSPRPRYSSASRTVVSDFAAQSCAPLSHRLFRKLADTASVQELRGIRPSHQCREGSNPRLTVETRDSF